MARAKKSVKRISGSIAPVAAASTGLVGMSDVSQLENPTADAPSATEFAASIAPGGNSGRTVISRDSHENTAIPSGMASAAAPASIATNTASVRPPMRPIIAISDAEATPVISSETTAGNSLSLHLARRDLALYVGRRLDPLHPGACDWGEWRTPGARGPHTQDPRRDASPARLAAGSRHLGPRNDALAGNHAGGFVIGHDGNNDPAINTAARLDPETGNGVVVLETGSRLLATTLAGEWLFWRTGNVDFLMLSMEAGNLLKVLAAGWIAIILTAVIIGWRFRRSTATSPR